MPDGPTASSAATEAQIARLRHDLSWRYKEVDFLRTSIQRALNAVLRPPALAWPGDEPPVMEASRILSEALGPRRTDEIDRLREAFGILAPICLYCDLPLDVDDVLANEQPAEGVWAHRVCIEAARAEARRD